MRIHQEQRPAKLLLIGLSLSLLLHVMLLLLPKPFGILSGGIDSAELKPVISMTLRLNAGQKNAPTKLQTTRAEELRESHATPAQSARPLPPKTKPVAIISAHEPLVSSPVSSPEPETSVSPRFDMDDLRAQARSQAVEFHQPSSQQANPQLMRDRNSARKESPSPDQLDRPILPSLAKRIKPPLLVASERTRDDGSRQIRFTGNTCMKIPNQLPMGFENPFGATILVATNCAD